MNSTNAESFPKHLLSIPYSPLSSLNTLDVYLPENPDTPRNEKYWIVYIHGGAYRDPLITSTSIVPTLTHLASTSNRVAGVTSINYRLSPYPAHPTHPSSPDDDSRNVVHPAHVEDILTALAWLQHNYGFEERYVLVGHSCGATLALQVAMGQWSARKETGIGEQKVKMPIAMVCVEGIYDLELLRNTHREYPLYQEFLQGAFGAEEQWRKASPARGKIEQTWTKGKVLVLAHSREDELVDWVQVETMVNALKEETFGMKSMILELKGKHHEIWENGAEMAHAIIVALNSLE